MNTVFYRAYDLVIESDTLFPHIPTAPPPPHKPNLSFHFSGDVPPPVPFPTQAPECWKPHPDMHDRHTADPQADYRLRVSIADKNGAVCIQYDDGFHVMFSADGRDVWGDWSSIWTLEQVTPYVFNPVIGMVLRLLGVTCLHSSAVLVEDRAVLFCGFSGAGKSTTAGYFGAQGHTILTDDIVRLEQRGSECYIHPGYPRLRLFSWAANAIGEDSDQLPLISPDRIKRYLNVQNGRYHFAVAAAPIAAIYILTDRSADAPQVIPLAPTQAILELSKHTYLQYLISPRMRAADFLVLSQLVQHVRICSVITPLGLSTLPDLYAMIMTDYAAHPVHR